MRYDHFSMLPIRAFKRVCGRMTYEGGGKGDSPDAPDYEPMARASKEAAEIGAALGREQLAQNQAQYEKNLEVAQPVIDAQSELMKQSIAQGNDYYDYMVKNQRPVESALNAEAMAAGTEQKQQEAADRVEADSLRGFTKAANIMARQGIRYGMSPNNIKSTAGSMSATMASNIAAGSGAARESEKNIGYAKKMDVAGLYRNLPGASQGAYSVATNAGNSAVGNQNQTSAQYLNGMNAGNQTIMQGQSQRLNGLGSVLNSQTSVFGNQLNAQSNAQAGVGSMVGAAMGAGATLFSDARLKENLQPIGKTDDGLTLYLFNYIGDPAAHIGVIAQEVIPVKPEAVVMTDSGFYAVDYSKLIKGSVA